MVQTISHTCMRSSNDPYNVLHSIEVECSLEPREHPQRKEMTHDDWNLTSEVTLPNQIQSPSFRDVKEWLERDDSN